MSSTTISIIFMILLVSSLGGPVEAGRSIQQLQSYAAAEPDMEFELLKRGDGYGWNDCEFSPLSCLLRRRRRSIQ